tara:strand:- start:1886 stop:3076 length:1191 start_codon:yes stop_codon:yes gene_type:complete
MGILAVDSIKSRTVAPVTVSDDLNVTGVSTVGVLTATSVVVGSAVTANSSGIIAGLVTATTFSGAFNGTTGTFSGDVSIGGTLTYEDVERVDATGLSTFRGGLNVGSPTGVGGTFDPAGGLSAGIGSFSSDLNIADKIVHLGDTDTTIRFPSADTITAETGGSERLRIDSSGRLGIGTAPYGSTAALHVYEPTNDRTLILDSGNTNGSHIRLWRQGVVQHYIGCSAGFGQGDYEDLGIRAKDNIIFHPGDSSSERMRITATGAISLNNGELIERCYIQSSPAWGSNGAVDLDNGVVQYNSSNYGSSPGTLAFTSSVGINTQMSTGDIMSLTMITAVNNAGGYINNIQIDGIAATETWVGGSAPTSGGTSGVDTYAFNIVKTADATFLVIANQVKTS